LGVDAEVVGDTGEGPARAVQPDRLFDVGRRQAPAAARDTLLFEPGSQGSTISAEGRRELGEGETGLVAGDEPVDLVVGEANLELSGASLTGTVGCRCAIWADGATLRAGERPRV
jgi:hypothetical protein